MPKITVEVNDRLLKDAREMADVHTGGRVDKLTERALVRLVHEDAIDWSTGEVYKTEYLCDG